LVPASEFSSDLITATGAAKAASTGSAGGYGGAPANAGSGSGSGSGSNSGGVTTNPLNSGAMGFKSSSAMVAAVVLALGLVM